MAVVVRLRIEDGERQPKFVTTSDSRLPQIHIKSATGKELSERSGSVPPLTPLSALSPWPAGAVSVGTLGCHPANVVELVPTSP